MTAVNVATDAAETVADLASRSNDAPGEPPSGFVGHVKAVLGRIKAHNVVIMAAGVAFYATLALVPTLLALVSVYTIVTDPADIAEQIDSLAGSMDPATADLIEEQLESAVTEAKSSGPTALVIGIALALFGASGAVQKLMLSVNLAYGAVESRKGWQVRGLAYLFTAGAIVGVAAIVFLLGALPGLMDWADLPGSTRTLLNFLRFPVLAAVMLSSLSILYRWGPDRSPRTPWKNPGAVVGTLAFLVFSGLFAAYFAFVGGLPASYGILGSIAALIIYFQLCAIAVIVGAETNAVLEQSATLPVAADDRTEEDRRSATPVPFLTAIAGLVALFVLGRSGD